MKLYYSKPSPFSRKVRASAILLGLDRDIELIDTDAYSNPPELHRANPLGLIPTLVTNDGFTFFESPVICEYLNGIAKDLPVIPSAGAQRLAGLRLEALGDGIMTAAVLRRGLSTQAKLPEDHVMILRRKAAVARTLDVLEAEPLSLHANIGSIAVACALGYLDLRFADEPWRENRPRLAAWFEEISKLDCIRLTDPGL